jgi:hypothetical protein
VWGSGTPRPTPDVGPVGPVRRWCLQTPEGLRWGCVGDEEGIMSGGATTAFLPNFVGFPSLRGLHSSTVQPRRTPRRVRRTPERPPGAVSRRAPWPPLHGAQLPRVSCHPVRSAAPTSAATSAPAGRPAAARRATPAGGATAAGVVAAVVPPARGRRTPVAGPPTRAGGTSAAVRPGPAARALADPALAPRANDGAHEYDCDHRQDDEEEHDVTLLPIPPKRPPVGAPVGA